MGTWEVFIKDHHEGYISWAEYESNQALLAGNAYGRAGDTKSGRGGRALLAGLICCARCGRRLSVLYTGRYPRPIYRCEQPNMQLGQRRCLSVAGKRIDETIAVEMLRAVAPMAIEAAQEAERMLRGGQHSELRVRKPRTGEHGCNTPEQALAVIRSMAGRWSDQDIAASLNRMGMPTGQGKTWTAHRVSSLRRVRGIHGYRSAEKNGE